VNVCACVCVGVLSSRTMPAATNALRSEAAPSRTQTTCRSIGIRPFYWLAGLKPLGNDDFLIVYVVWLTQLLHQPVTAVLLPLLSHTTMVVAAATIDNPPRSNHVRNTRCAIIVHLHPRARSRLPATVVATPTSVRGVCALGARSDRLRCRPAIVAAVILALTRQPTRISTRTWQGLAWMVRCSLLPLT
jgi:hypothetical protein